MAQELQKYPKPGDVLPPYEHQEFPTVLYGPPLTEAQVEENASLAAEGKPPKHEQKTCKAVDPDDFEAKVATGKWFDTPLGKMDDKPNPPTVEERIEQEAALADALEANEQLVESVKKKDDEIARLKAQLAKKKKEEEK